MDSILKTLIEIDKEANNTKLTTIHKQRSIDKSICANCQEEVKEIEDEEYRISALCLECQKEFFKEPEDE
jgi:predicted amidophosphoribosyltransferase|tara:strand:+ start:417 stop:626 length:210 start_codon:yes stop_codon:yes gene_type:complete